MNTNRAVIEMLTVAALAIVLFGASSIGNNSPHRVSAFNPQPDPPAFGMLAITHEQSARLNVAETGDVQPGPCRQVEMTFFDGQGNELLRSSQCVTPGHAVFLDLNGISLVSTTPRTEIRAKVHVIEPPGDPDRNQINIVPTLEVFDNESGRTTVVLPAVQSAAMSR